MTQIDGLRGTANINQDRRVVDMAKDIALLEPNAAPLTVLMKQMSGKAKVAKNPEYKNLVDELAPKWDQANGAVTSGGTTLTVDNGAYFSVNDVVDIPSTGEQVLVTAVSGNNLTITRTWGTTSASAIADNAKLRIVANASAEGDSAPTPKTETTTTITNYTQIIQTPFGVTGTQDASELYGGKDMVYLAKKYGIEHKKAIESAFLLGEKKEDTSGSQPKRFTAGLNSLVTSNVTDAGGTLTEAEFEAFMRQAFRYGGTRKALVASPLLISAINSWAAGKLQTVPSDKTYGIDVMQYLTGHGTVNLIKHNLLEEDYAGVGFVVDMDTIGYRYLAGRDTHLKTNIQNNDEDSRKDEYLSEVGFYLTQEKANAKIEGITDFS